MPISKDIMKALELKRRIQPEKAKSKNLKSNSNLTDSTRHLSLAYSDWVSIFLEFWETDIQIACRCKLTTLPCCMFLILRPEVSDVWVD
jgi:hypothetical protein